MHQYYTIHKIVDGKWEVTIWIYEDDNFAGESFDRPDLRALIADNYDADPFGLAGKILDNVLHCERVQITTLSGSGCYVERG